MRASEGGGDIHRLRAVPDERRRSPRKGKLEDQPIALYDNVIMRTIVDLTDDQVKSLAALCAAQGISRAEAVRRAVARLLAEEHRPNRSRAFGAWSEKKLDGAATVRRLRDEWER